MGGIRISTRRYNRMTRDEANAYNKELYYLRKKYHRCVCCGREAFGNLVRCARCLGKQVYYDTAEDQRIRHKKLYTERREAGLCVECGDPADNNVRCDKCRAKNAKRLRVYRLKKKYGKYTL